MRFIWVAMWVCAVAGAEDERAQAREHFVKGSKAYDLGLMDEAIHEYMEAYRLRDDPALIYNIAQAHRQAGHKTEAVRFYKVYLGKLPHAANRSEVTDKIVELQKAIEQERKTLVMPPDQAIAPGGHAEPKAPEAPPPAAPEVPVAVAVAPVPLSPSPRRLKIAGLATVGVGAALAIGGLVALVLSQQDADRLSNANDQHLPYDPSRYSAYRAEQISGGVLLGIGAAALVTGTVLSALGARRSRASLSLALSPRQSSLAVRVGF